METAARLDHQTLSHALLDEILGVMGLRGRRWARWAFSPVFARPVERMAGWLAEFDGSIAQHGWCGSMHDLMHRFVGQVRVHGTEHLPGEGPLLVAANHPGAYDLLILASCLCREDFKVIASDIGIIRLLPNARDHFIFLSSKIENRMAAARAGLRHLQSGGCLLVYARGEVEPDPQIAAGAEQSLLRWSPSLEIFLERTPGVRACAAIVSGVLAAEWFHHPMLRLWRRYEQRQKIAEIFQVIQQLAGRRSLHQQAGAAFSRPKTLTELQASLAPGGRLLEAIQQEALALLRFLWQRL